MAPYPDYCHAIAVVTETHHDFGGHARHVSEGQGTGSSTSRDGAAGSRDGDHDPPATMGQQFADVVCHRESLRSQTVKDVITPDEQTTRLRLGALAVCFVSLLGNCQVSEDH